MHSSIKLSSALHLSSDFMNNPIYRYQISQKLKPHPFKLTGINLKCKTNSSPLMHVCLKNQTDNLSILNQVQEKTHLHKKQNDYTIPLNH